MMSVENSQWSTSNGKGMYVIKRSGRKEPVHFDKITSRIKKLCYNLDREYVDPVEVSQKVCLGVYKGVTTSELDELAAETAAHLSSQHPDYGLLAARIAVSNLHKDTKKCFTEVMNDLYSYIHPKTKQPAPLLSDHVYQFIMKHKDRLDSAIVYDRDFTYDYFGFKTMAKSYLLRLDGKIAERPQHMLLRVACGIHSDDIEACIETYELLSHGWFTHATPTMFNSGTPKPQMSSCFLLTMSDDSIDGIFSTLKQCALISKYAGGIGLSVHNIRATGSYIRGTNGNSNGLIPMLRCFNSTARYVDQCFPPLTEIYTSSTETRPISKLVKGDQVLTHTGKLSTITKILSYELSQYHLYEVGTQLGSLKVTSQHPFLCLRNQGRSSDATSIQGRFSAKLQGLTWEDACDLKPGDDWLALPKSTVQASALDPGGVDVGTHVLFQVTSCMESPAEYAGRLYDLEVEDDHSYVTKVGAVHNGGGKRKGSFAIYLEPWHADISAFLQLKKNTGSEEHRARDLFQAMWIPDLFMRRVEENKSWSLFCPNEAPNLFDVWGPEFDALYERYENEGRARKVVPARQIWNEIMEAQIETGGPYMLYKDRVNSCSNYQHIGTIRSSNLCVSPDTKILTDLGQLAIGALAGKKVNVWNGDKWSPVVVKQTGRDQKLVRVEFSDNTEICCTPEHKFIIDGFSRADSNRPLNKYDRIAAKNLKLDMRLVRWNLPNPVKGDENENIGDPYTHGFFCADGTYRNKTTTECGQPLIALHGEKKKLLPYLAVRSTSGKETAAEVLNVLLPLDLAPKFAVPINAELTNKLLWFAGLCDGDGTVVKSGKAECIQIASVNLQFLRDIRLMLQTLGVGAHIGLMHEARQCEMPDHKGGTKMYDCQKCYRMVISASRTHQLLKLGLKTYRLKFSGIEPNDTNSRYIKIKSVTPLSQKSDTFCFTEEKNHAGVFNGHLLGNCSEIVEFTSPGEIAVCNLASIKLHKYINADGYDFKKLHEVTKVITRNLNKVIDVNHYPVPEAKKSNMRHRPIGIGVQGLADTLALLRMPFESPAAKQLNRDIFEAIYFAALTASNELAEKLGPYESYPGSPMSKGQFHFDMCQVKPSSRWDWEGLRAKIAKFGTRNAMLIAPMPTASTSQILSSNECLAGDTPVTLDSGLAIPIERFPSKDMSVIGWNSSIQKGEISRQSNLLDQGTKSCVELTLQDGRKLCCTPSHKFLTTDHKWVEAKDLVLGESKVVVSVNGALDIISDDEKNYELKTETMVFSTKTPAEREKLLAFARILGYMLTDGTIYETDKGIITISICLGSKLDAHAMSRDIELLEGKPPKMNDTGRVYRLRLHHLLSKAMASLKGVPTGKRITQPAELPRFLIDPTCPKAVIREYLAGAFGGDGIFQNIDTGGVIRGPSFSQSIISKHAETLRIKLMQMGELLKRVGVPSYTVTGPWRSYHSPESKIKPHPDSLYFRLILPATSDFARNVGVRYCMDKLCRLCMATTYWTYCENVMAQRYRVLDEVESQRKSGNYILSKAMKAAHAIVFSKEVALAPGSHVPMDTAYKQFTRSDRPSSRMKNAKRKREESNKKREIENGFVHGLLDHNLYSDSKIKDNVRAEQELRAEQERKNVHGVIRAKFRSDPIRSESSSVDRLNASQFLTEIGCDGWKNIKYLMDRDVCKLPTFHLKVIDRKEVGNHHVWDISVDKNHSFLAAGVMVHNCFEPFTSNIYVRRTLAGEFVCVNRYLLFDLIKRGLWTKKLKNELIARNGSVQEIAEIPQDLKDLYKTVWEIKIRALIDMAADRGAFVDQSQSFNVHMRDATFAKLTAMHFYGWKSGLKTGSYYIRTEAAADAIKFTVDQQMLRQVVPPPKPPLTITNPTPSPPATPVGASDKDIKTAHVATTVAAVFDTKTQGISPSVVFDATAAAVHPATTTITTTPTVHDKQPAPPPPSFRPKRLFDPNPPEDESSGACTYSCGS